MEKKSNHNSSDYRSRNFSGNWSNHFINDYINSLISNGIEKTNQTFANHKKEHIPQNLYKFFPPTIYSLIGIQSQSVYLSSPRSFNDPFDSYVCIETDSFIKLYLLQTLKNRGFVTEDGSNDAISKKEYWEIHHSWSKDSETPQIASQPNRLSFSSTVFEILKSKSLEFKNLVREVRLEARRECANKIENIRNMQFKISCFSNFQNESELLANTTMWSHYADNHRGFCVKYSLDFEQLENKDSILCGLFPVKYTSRVPKISPRELIRLKYENGRLLLNKQVLKTTYKTLTTKSKFWNYEKEWRLIVSDKNSEILTNNTLKFLKIDTIYLGCRIESNLKKCLIQFAADKNINVYQTDQNNEKFILNTVRQDLKILENFEFFDKLSDIINIPDGKERQRKMMLLNRKDEL